MDGTQRRLTAGRIACCEPTPPAAMSFQQRASPPRRPRSVAFAAVAAAVIFAAAGRLSTAAGALQHATWTESTASIGLPLDKAVKYSGACIADFDGDGQYDMMLSNHDSTRLHLFFNNGAGAFTRAPDPLRFLIDAHGMAAGDVMGTGAADFIVAEGGSNGGQPVTPRMLMSMGRARKLVQAQQRSGLLGEPGGRGRTPLLFDMNRDGRLDLLVLNYRLGEFPGPRQKVYENGKPDGKFTRLASTGLEDVDVERAILTDLNGDGRLDVVAFPFFRLFLATGDFKFKDVTAEWMAGVPNWQSRTAGVLAAAELDTTNDGLWDLYLVRGYKGPDMLLRNSGKGRFVDASSGLPAQGNAAYIDVSVGDTNNDGLTDIFVGSLLAPANGKPVVRADALLTNAGDGTFVRSLLHGARQVTAAPADSVQLFDYDLDGRLDLLVGGGDEVVAWRNVTGVPGPWSLFTSTIARPEEGGFHWLIVRVGRSPNGRAAAGGAALTVVAMGDGQVLTLRRRVGGAGGSATTEELRMVHFGLGALPIVSSVEVIWSDGSRLKRRDAVADAVFDMPGKAGRAVEAVPQKLRPPLVQQRASRARATKAVPR